MKNLNLFSLPFLIILTHFLGSCTNEKAEKAAIMKTFADYKNEIRNLGEPEKYITQNSFSYFDEILKTAKSENPSDVINYIENSKEFLSTYKTLLNTRYGFVRNEVARTDEKKDFRKFLMDNDCGGIWTNNTSKIENLKILKFNFGTFGNSCTLQLRSDFARIRGRKLEGVFASELMMKKEDGIWKIDVPSSLEFYELQEKGWMQITGTGKDTYKINVNEEVEKKYPNVNDEELLMLSLANNKY